jgi:hypothetical protein
MTGSEQITARQIVFLASPFHLLSPTRQKGSEKGSLCPFFTVLEMQDLFSVVIIISVFFFL